VYAEDERPPASALLVLGLQHAGTAMAFISYVLVAAHLAGLDRASTQSLVAMTLLGMAFATALQAWGGRFGAGALLSHIPSPILIPFVVPLLAAHGPGGLAIAAVVRGGTAMAMASLVRHMRSFFPPPVVGVVVTMGGVALIASAVRNALGLDAEHRIDGESAVIAMVTLACIVTLSVWGGRLRLMALLLSMVAGVLTAAALGKLGDTQVMHTVPLLDWPRIDTPVFSFDPGLIAALALITVLQQLDVLGCVTMLDKLNDPDWKRADMRAVSGAIRGNGLSGLLGGMLGSFPTSIGSTNIALVNATRSTARVIGFAAALMLAAIAFLPQLTMALTLMPAPVLGAVGLYAAGFMMVSGTELTASRAMDSRTTFAVGLSLCAGLAIMQLPGLTSHVPPSLHFLLGNGFVVAGILVIALNLLMRIGTTQRNEQPLDAASPTLPTDITDFVETRGAAWGARRAVVQRAALAALEAAEAIANAGDGRRVTGIRGRFDEFNLDLELLHSGAPLPLRALATPPLSANLLEGDDSAMDAALAQVSGALLRHLADKVSAQESEGSAVLRLHFEH
jgi:xanthine permease XanP